MTRFLACVVLFAGAPHADWPMFGGNPQRTGSARGEKILTRENAGTLELKWKLRLDNVPKELTSLTAPVVADQIKTPKGIKENAIVGGSSDNLYATPGSFSVLAAGKL